MSGAGELTRRGFLRVTATSGAGLALAFYLPGLARPGAAPAIARPAPFALNAWIRIDAEGVTTLVVGQAEMGQGVHTSLAMILAEELDADWQQVHVEMAPADPAYGNPALGGKQITVGSSSVRGFWLPLRQAGATARAMLVSAAAAGWQADRASLRTEPGAVIHPDGRRLTYGALVARAATLPVPSDVPLKDPADFRLIGRSLPRVDLVAKVDGSARFGIDVRVPGMLTAVIAHCPVFGGRVKRHDATAALRVSGVRRVVPISSGIAVIADGYWAAKRGCDALVVEWDEGALAALDGENIRRRFAARAGEPGLNARADGEAAAALASAAHRLDAVYELPYVHHAPIEPMNATAHVTGDRCVVWVPTQGPGIAQEAAARVSGLPPSAVEIQSTLIGGAFGNRVGPGLVVEAVEASKAVGAPVQVIWPREDDVRHGIYRPASYHRLAAGLDSAGRVVAWTHTVVAPSVFARSLSEGQVDGSAVEAASNHPYSVPNVRVDWVRDEPGVPIGTLRSVGKSSNVFVVESFVDELAAAAGQDPYQYRLALLADQPELRTVLEFAAKKAGWERRLPSGEGRGIALYELGGSRVAQVAEVRVDSGGSVRVSRVVCALDCGTVVHPDIVRAQMEGGIALGLSMALGEAITVRGGRVVQSNFHDYHILRIDAMPAVEVHIVPSLADPKGVGEAGVPGIAPAVTNAIFAATGRRVRSLPLSTQ
jgi:isoquinoline 1-oxidoreductase beta subunit